MKKDGLIVLICRFRNDAIFISGAELVESDVADIPVDAREGKQLKALERKFGKIELVKDTSVYEHIQNNYMPYCGTCYENILSFKNLEKNDSGVVLSVETFDESGKYSKYDISSS